VYNCEHGVGCKHTYLKGITNIDDERIRGGFDRDPGAMAMADLQTTH
jgi:hypothetical protein